MNTYSNYPPGAEFDPMAPWNKKGGTLPPTSEVYDVEFGGIDHKDHPKYSDAYIKSAKAGGCELDATEINLLSDDREWFQEQLWNFLSNCNDLPE